MAFGGYLTVGGAFSDRIIATPPPHDRVGETDAYEGFFFLFRLKPEGGRDAEAYKAIAFYEETVLRTRRQFK